MSNDGANSYFDYIEREAEHERYERRAAEYERHYPMTDAGPPCAVCGGEMVVWERDERIACPACGRLEPRI